MPIQYNPQMSLKDHLAIYFLPVSLGECVEQFRVDQMESANLDLGLKLEDYKVLAYSQKPFSWDRYSKVDHAAGLFHPMEFYQDKSLFSQLPGRSAFLPPVPSTLTRFDPRFALWSAPFVDEMRKRLADLDDAQVLTLAAAVSTLWLDQESHIGPERDRNITYIAMNNLDNPARERLSDLPWEKLRRVISMPNMIDTRKKDLLDLFEQTGMPLRGVELEHIDDETIFEYATDMRQYVLQQNRHIAFCSKCSARVLEVNTQLHQPVSANVM